MKNKINVTMGRQEVTDEELERFKDFDSLLAKHRQLQGGRKNYWSIIAPAVVLVGVTVYVMITQFNESENSKSIVETTQLQEPTVIEEGSKSTIDSSVQNESKPVISTREKPNPKKNSVVDSEKEKSNPPVQKRPDQKDTVSVEREETKLEPPVVNKTESVYIQAEPVNGYQNLYEYFGRELIYPTSAVKDSIQGVLTVSFLINKEGKPEQIKTSGSLGKAFEAEAIRLVESMPLWKPATLNGKPVSSRLSLPLTFQLNKK